MAARCAIKVPFTVLRNEDIRMGDLRERFDVMILAPQSVPSILHGVRQGRGPAARTRSSRSSGPSTPAGSVSKGWRGWNGSSRKAAL